MRTEKQIEASRANGAKSRGPVTAEGKKKSSINALRHGLLSNNILVYGESTEIFATVLTDHLRKFQPADNVEQGMIEEMAASYWRLRRLWAIEKRLIDDSVEQNPDLPVNNQLTHAFTELTASGALRLLDRYENRLHRMYQRSFHNFLKFREFEPDETLEPVTLPEQELPQFAEPEEPFCQTNPSRPEPLPEAAAAHPEPLDVPYRQPTRLPGQTNPPEEPQYMEIDLSPFIDSRLIPPVYLLPE